MILSLALVVFGASIAVFFSEEWTTLYKKIMAIPGFSLLLPLLLFSWLIEKYERNGYWFLLWLEAKLHQMEQWLASVFSAQPNSWHVDRIVYLFLFAGLPVWVFWLNAKRQGIDEVPWPYAYRIGIALWIVAAVLFTVHT